MSTSPQVPNRILVVDDDTGNLRVLHELLSKNGYKVHALKDSRDVENFLLTHMPDLFLLDINMPHRNGFELAEMLQNNPKTHDIPIIFISASHHEQDIKRGFKLGAVDYITKPVRSFEVLARVDTHIRVKCQQLALAEKVDEIEQLRQQEREQYQRVEDMRTQFLQAATHDLKNPLFNIIGYLDLIEDFGSELTPEHFATFRKHIDLSTDKMRQLISDMLDLFHVESKHLKLDLRPIDLGEYLQSELVEAFNLRASQKRINIELYHPEETVHAYIDGDLFFRVIDNIVSNAIKYSPEQTTITVRYSNIEHGIAFEIQDQGFGMTQETIDNLFIPFYRSSNIADNNIEGTGLGMAISKQIVERHDGVIDVTSQIDQGTIFRVIIPHHSVVELL